MTNGPGRPGQVTKDVRRARPFASLRFAAPLLSVLMLAQPGAAQTVSGEQLAPFDIIELSVTGWSALRGGAAEGALLSNSFTIDTGGVLDLPILGRVQAAGLSEDELATLIADRLPAPSGFQERAMARVRRRQMAVGSVGLQAEAAAAAEKKALDEQKAHVAALERDLAMARQELDGARAALELARKDGSGQATRAMADLQTERRRSSSLQAELDAAQARTANQLREADQARKAAEAHADAQRELTEGERTNAGELRRDLTAARQDLALLQQTARAADDTHDGPLAKELETAKATLEQLQQTVRTLSADAHASSERAAEQDRALAGAQQKSDGLAAELTQATAKLAALQDAADLAAKQAGDGKSKADAALVAERQKTDGLAAELKQANAKLAALQDAVATAQKEAGDGKSKADAALVAERQKTDGLAAELKQANAKLAALQDAVATAQKEAGDGKSKADAALV